MHQNNELHRALYDVVNSLRSQGMTREAAQVVSAAERVAAGPELVNSNHITQVGRAELGLHGGQRTKMWEQFGPVLGWFRVQSGPSRGVLVPQLMPGESMANFTKRSQQWLQNYAKISGHQELTSSMQKFFAMMQQPSNMKQLEDTNRAIYQEFDRQSAQANAKAKQRGVQQTSTPNTNKVT